MEGENIKKFRELKNMTQEELAEIVGVSRPMIAMIERGTKSPTLRLAKLIAKALDVSIADF